MPFKEGNRSSTLVAVIIGFVLAVNLILFCSLASAQPATEWTEQYGKPTSEEQACSMVQTSDGGYAIAGTTNMFGVGNEDFLLVKTDENGTMEWNQTYGTNGSDIAYCMIQTSDDGFFIVGSTDAYDVGYNDFWYVKTDSSGNVIFSGYHGEDDGVEIAYCVVQTNDGGYVIGGSKPNFFFSKLLLIKVDSGGSMVAQQDSYDAIYPAISIVKTNDGGIVTASSNSVAKWNQTSLSMMFSASSPGTSLPRSIIQTDDGGFLIAGYTNVTDTNFVVYKTNSNFAEQWNQTYGGVGSEIAYNVIQTTDGGYALTGFTNSYGAGGNDFWLIKTDSAGNEEGNKTYGGPEDERAYSVVETSDGGYALAGSTSDNEGDFLLVKTLFDVVSPQTSVSFGGVLGENGWFTSNVEVTLSATDSHEVESIGYSFDNIDWFTYTAPFSVTTEGETTVYYNSTDTSSNTETTKTTTISIDETPPTGTVTINGGATHTNTTTVTLTLSASDVTSGIAEMCFSNNGIDYGEWLNYTTTYTWNLQAGAGQKTVYARFKDNAGLTTTQTNNITLELPIVDTVAPQTIADFNGALGENGWFTSNVEVILSASDDSGIQSIEYSFDNISWLTYTTPFTVTTEGETTFYYRSTDTSFNTETTKTNTVSIDKTPPTGTITINSGATHTNTTTVTLTLSANDNTSGIVEICFSNNGVDYCNWLTYNTTNSWILQEGDGEKTVYVKFKDNAGLTTTQSNTITLALESSLGGDFPPEVVALIAVTTTAAVAAVAAYVVYHMKKPQYKMHTQSFKPFPSPQERIVNTGFSSKTNPKEFLDKMVPLAPNKSYYFRFEVGPIIEGTIEVKPEPLPVELLPADARLKVVLFAFNGEIEITPNRDVGEIQITKNWNIEVVRHVEHPENIPSNDDILKRCLFFPIHTPNSEGEFHLRCNVYYKQNLVQSRLITVKVNNEQKRAATPAMQSILDYNMSKKLDPANLVNMEPKTLSVMLNDNGDGTHCFRIVGAKNYKGDRSFDAQTLEKHVELSRKTFRSASWGSEQPWSGETDEKKYRYKKFNLDVLKDDLICMAIRGSRFWYEFTGRKEIAYKHDDVQKLAAIMLKPGRLEFAIKEGTEATKYMFPAAMMYDYDLNTGINPKYMKLCPSFLNALKSAEPLENTECFKGNCPSRGNDKIVCPSGFLGFRHSIGVPYGIEQKETLVKIQYVDAPKLTVAAYPFETWDVHKEKLKKFTLERNWKEANSIHDTLLKLKSTDPQLVYFYCHGGTGGLDKNIPYLEVKKDKIDDNELVDGITPDNLKKINWESSRPLVFLNGCHTTELKPELAMNFVSSFLRSNAAGVIGTEISIFEALASSFAEECLRLFLVEGKTIGDAVRLTRLNLLKQGNPLGLIYTIYANGSLQLEKRGSPAHD